MSITKSGIVYQVGNDCPASGIKVFAVVQGSGSIAGSGTTTGSGTFTMTLPDDNLVYTYFTLASGTIGYCRTYPAGTSPITLYIGNSAPKASAFPIGNLNLYATGLHSTTIFGMDFLFPYLFVVGNCGLDVIDVRTKTNKAYYTALDLTCLDVVYLNGVIMVVMGTNARGLLNYNFDPAHSGDISAKVEQRESLRLSSSQITFVAVDAKQEYAVATSSGVAFVNQQEQKFYHNFSGGVSSIAISPSGTIYYSPTGSGLFVKTLPMSDWVSPDYSYCVSNGKLRSNSLNDIAINTASGSSYVFVATQSGITGYVEDLGNPEAVLPTFFEVGTPISGTISNVASIELSVGCTLTSGSLLFSTYSAPAAGVIQVIDLATGTIKQTVSGTGWTSDLGRSGITVSGAKFVQGLL